MSSASVAMHRMARPGRLWTAGMKSARQTTLRDHAALFGVGVHSGLPVTLTMHPADADTGIRFIRTEIDGGQHLAWQTPDAITKE